MDYSYFQNRVVIVTGGASGIGLATCMELAKHGARIAMLDMDQDSLEHCHKTFADKGYDILALECDVTNENSCQESINQVLNRFGQIDILFNNAGITQRGLFENTEINVFKKVMVVNFLDLYTAQKRLSQILLNQRV